MFQGWGRTNNYFEGWYYKLVTADQRHAYAIIPGIALNNDDSHAFVQTMDGISKTSTYTRFNKSSFQPHPQRFIANIQDNSFTADRISLNLPHMHGTLKFENVQKYVGSVLSPGIMGWYSFVPFMQCYHGLVSIHHTIVGSLKIRDKEVDFTGGKGYIEKDWGSSFPKAWVWTQCNNYQGEDDLSVMASVAHIPWLGTHFIGFLAIVYFRGTTKIFTTYTNAQVDLELNDSQVVLEFRDKEGHLTIHATQDAGTDLLAPRKGSMTSKVNESLMARHEIRFFHKETRLSAFGTNAGLEVGGNSLILLNQT